MNNIYLDYSSFRKISHALEIIAKDSMLRNIFHIAICHGHLGLPPDQNIQSVNKTNRVTSKKIYFNSSDSDVESTPPKTKSPQPVIHHRNENEILQAFKEQIGSIKIITFTLLSRIEQRLCEKFQTNHFHELGYGTFMNYLQQNQQLLFPADTKFNFASSESNDSSTTVVIPFEDVEQFILQALDRSIDQQYIEQMICYHFQIESFEQLGHGAFRSVFISIKQNKKSNNTSIHYECMMLDEIPMLKQKLNKPSKSFLKGIEYYFIQKHSIVRLMFNKII
jgi:hypothetical protein